MWLTKGMRVHVKGFVQHQPGTYSLAGVQPKVQVSEVELTGTIAHVRGDAPTAEECKTIGIWLVPDDPEVAKGFERLTAKAERCEKCDRIEIGPFNVNLVQAVIQ